MAICSSCLTPPKYQWEEKYSFHSSFVMAEFSFCSFVGFGALPLFFEDQYKLIIHLQNSVSGIRKAAHDGSSAGSVHSRGFLPDYCPHIVHTEGFAKANYLGPL